MRTSLLTLATILALATSACGASDSTPAASPTPQQMDMGDSATRAGADQAIGMPGDPAAADRIIDITATDSLRFEPASVSVKESETITFRVANPTATDHEFVLGTNEQQRAHEAEMANDSSTATMDSSDPNAISVPAGESRDLTWTFGAPAIILFACHVPGHFQAGMVGTIHVTE